MLSTPYLFQSAVSLNNESGLTLEPTTLSDVLFSTVSQTQPNPPQPEQKEPAKPVDWAQIEQTLTPAFLGNLNTVNLPFDMHIPSFLGTNWQYQLLNEKGEEIRLSDYKGKKNSALFLSQRLNFRLYGTSLQPARQLYRPA